MARQSPFDHYVREYEQWFADHTQVYQAEIRAVQALLPPDGRGVEIGVGSGRFAEPLGIPVGVEPSRQMATLAKERGIRIIQGVAEHLPFSEASFDFVLMVTTICFVADIDKALSEAHRILTPNGVCLLGFVDRNSPLGQTYLEKQGDSLFYRDAVFYSADEVLAHLSQAGFHDFDCRQTIFAGLAEIAEDEPVLPGYGQGSFIVVRGRK